MKRRKNITLEISIGALAYARLLCCVGQVMEYVGYKVDAQPGDIVFWNSVECDGFAGMIRSECIKREGNLLTFQVHGNIFPPHTHAIKLREVYEN